MRKVIVGLMGPGEGASAGDCQTAYQLGRLIAQQGWVLLTGGRDTGVMEAACQGAQQEQGLTIGILPDSTGTGASAAVDITILTGMGQGRNIINVLSSQVIIACGMGAGTASEVCLALKTQKSVVLVNADPTSQLFFQTLAPTQVFVAETPEQAIATAQTILSSQFL
jgi:hypothetical protein